MAMAVSNRKLQGPTLFDKDLLIDPFKLFINGSQHDKISHLWLDSLSIKTKNIQFILRSLIWWRDFLQTCCVSIIGQNTDKVALGYLLYLTFLQPGTSWNIFYGNTSQPLQIMHNIIQYEFFLYLQPLQEWFTLNKGRSRLLFKGKIFRVDDIPTPTDPGETPHLGICFFPPFSVFNTITIYSI